MEKGEEEERNLRGSIKRTRESFLIRGNLLLPDFQRRISNDLSLSLSLFSSDRPTRSSNFLAFNSPTLFLVIYYHSRTRLLIPISSHAILRGCRKTFTLVPRVVQYKQMARRRRFSLTRRVIGKFSDPPLCIGKILQCLPILSDFFLQ